jgi:hypothetical protein
MAAYKVRQNAYLKRDQVNNFGRVEKITTLFPNFSQELASIQVDEVMSWTVSVDTLLVTPNTRVLAKISYGGGNAESVIVTDASDHIDVPVVGDTVKVSIALEPLLAFGDGPPLFSPPSAKVSAGISAEVPGFPFPATYFVPYLGNATATGDLGALDPTGTGAIIPSPGRLASYHVVTTQPTASFFQLFDQAAALAPGDIPVWVDPLPGNSKIDHTFLNPRGFATRMQWALSTTANIYTPVGGGVFASVFAELARRPIGKVVTSIPSSTGQ